ncbi:hypothetical protein CRUP_008364 [Coryphaenoides rupestris]|nr:hypothetical protein CRUP_008364 [Coryphaenoides rupestris]
MWVSLSSQIEDRATTLESPNNRSRFSASVCLRAAQEETVAELRTVEGEAASYLDQISRYYITRAKLVSKVAKYPHVVTLHDMILKNFEKIKKPRNSNAESLY